MRRYVDCGTQNANLERKYYVTRVALKNVVVSKQYRFININTNTNCFIIEIFLFSYLLRFDFEKNIT